jgi:N-acetylneuraminic acid mutarotase
MLSTRFNLRHRQFALPALCLLGLITWLGYAHAFFGPTMAAGDTRAQRITTTLRKGSIRSQRTLTVAERIAYQRRIEEVYWRHRAATQPTAQPPIAFTEAVPEAAIRAKVEDTLRKSAALAMYWQRPVTSAQLQAELGRMATQTRQPEVLRELWAALDDDPYVIAECLARPLLVERELRSWYAQDERFHGPLRARAEADLQAHAGAPIKTLGGEYVERQMIKQGAGSEPRKSRLGADAGVRAQAADEQAAKLSDGEWQRVLAQLEESFADAPQTAAEPLRAARKIGRATRLGSLKSLPLGRISRLQESETQFYVTSVLARGAEQLTVATVSWPKEPLDVWWQTIKNDLPLADVESAAPSKAYELPQPAAAAASDDTWRPTTAALSARENHTAVWTGSEMIVWGGFYNPSNFTDYAVTVAGRYNPATDSWTLTSTTGAPAWRERHTAVWTGTEMIVWGGYTGGSGVTSTGARYNPATDKWTPTSTTNTPAARSRHTAVWTGSRMLVWGGRTGDTDDTIVNTGGVYDPASNTWTQITNSNAPLARQYHTAVWTGTEMIVWGGANSQNGVNTGGRYNPQTNSWQQTSTTGAPTPRYAHNAVWTGTRMLVWGGASNFSAPTFYNNGALYDPANNSWTPTTTTNAPTPRDASAVVWTGTEMILWGGFNDAGRVSSGGRYNPQSNTWQTLSTAGAPAGVVLTSAVWTGSEMIVWGGQEATRASDVNIGARYNPQTNLWLPVTNPQNAGPRTEHPAVWTGAEMIVWGSYTNLSTPTNTGGRYYPATDTWLPTSMTNVPQYRYAPLAVWTGSEMIVWGGCSDSFCFNRLNTGGRYNPTTDIWQATTTVGAAEARYWFSAVWTGTEMIVWGGCDAQTCGPGGNSDRFGLNNGGRYNPQTDTWTPLSTTNTPASRWQHTAVWSGSEMIVFGGISGDGPYNTGGRYNPQTDTWTLTTTTNAPTARNLSRAVWTGTRMIVWGGYNSLLDQYFNTGALYDPTSDSWTPTGTANAPTPRNGHSSVWTGAEMIVWGGCAGANCQNETNTGGRYNPQTNTWRAMSNIEAPSPRDEHSAVWTGTEMIVFGGEPCARCEPVFDTGGRYAAQPPAGANNNPPTVTLTQPVGGTLYNAPASITFNANAADSDGSISKVDFYANSALVGTDTSAPYSFTWTNVTRVGDYQLQSVATDNLGASAGSASVTVHVNSGTTVQITSPADGASVNQYGSVTLTAVAAAGSYTTLARVDFYDGPSLIGGTNTPPYTMNWQPYAVGARQITARALDNAGDTVVSAPITLNVNAPAQVIGGRITNAAGAGLPGVTITFGSGTLPSATTDADGFYTTSVSGPASFRVAPTKAGYHFSPSYVTVQQSDGDRTLNFQGAQTSVLISEFRARGPAGALDEFVELYNNSDVPLTVDTTDGSNGWALLSAADGARRAVIFANTVIPARGHLLITGSGYSLTGAYTSATGQPGDATLMTDIPDNTGLALFNTNTDANWTVANRLDAVGFSSTPGTAATMYREGAGLADIAVSVTPDEQLCFARKLSTGTPQDTGDNAQDFALVSTTGTVGGVQVQLGAPGPEGLTSPIQRNAQLKAALIDPQQLSTSAPNRVRDFAPVQNGPQGTLTIRRRFTNKTGQPVTALRFRLVDVTTRNSPGAGPAQSDLRAVSSVDVLVQTTSGAQVLVRGTSIDQPAQSLGGGLNSAFVVVLPGGTLANGATVNVQFALGVQQTGAFRFLVNVEALP